MSDRSKIEWTDATWNPLRAKNPATGKAGHHCVKISPACAHCYAASMNKRLGTGLDYSSNSPAEVYLDEDALVKPLSWKRARKIFVCSMTDLFLDSYTDEQLDRVFALMYQAQWHTFQVLTKRPERMRDYLTGHRRMAAIGCAAYQLATQLAPEKAAILTNNDFVQDVIDNWPLPNVWIGATIEDHERCMERLDPLLQSPAAVRFISVEPLLDDLDLALRNWQHIGNRRDDCRIDWVIVGGESGNQARPMRAEWARLIRDDCQHAGVAFFFKQWGEWLPPGQDGARIGDDQILNCSDAAERVGKAKAGRLLDGREWNEFPAASDAAVV